MERAEYLKLAEVEDRMWYFRCLHGRAFDGLRRGLGDVEPARILDAGCGTGGLIRRLSRGHPHWRFVGVDNSPIACELAAERGCDVRQGSITELPFADREFDGVVCADVLYHITEHARALAEFHRCLRPGGVIVINVPAYRWLWSYHDQRVESKHRFTRAEVVQLLRDAGFGRVWSTYWNTLPFPLIVARRKLFPPKNGESDVKPYPWLVEKGFDASMFLERSWNQIGFALPFGSSVFAVARKPL